MARAATALCVLLACAGAGGAHAHDSGPAIARALVALRQSPLSVDPAVTLSEQQEAVIRRRLERTTGIRVAMLPVDFSLSAVAAAREVDLHLALGGTVVVVLGGDIGATSTDVEGQRLGTLVRKGQTVYNREGPVPALVGLVDGLEAAKLTEGEGGPARRWTVALAATSAVAGAAALALLARRRARKR